MSESTPAPAGRAPGERNHGMIIFSLWLILSVAADLVIWFVWFPHLPPGRMSVEAQGQQWDIAVLTLFCAPVLLFVWTYATYALITWRRKEGDDEDGPPIHGNTKIQATWITATAVIVLFLFGFGTYELIVPAGAGAGEGPSPIWKPNTTNLLQVQAIGQQWVWTYRLPQFGGIETTQLELPKGQEVEIHVTSLDVIHSFWAYQLGVKADANPGVDNIAYFKPQQLGSFVVRCNELCGIWHGAMFNYGKVVSPAAFQAWASGIQAKEQTNGVLAALPPYALTYDPTTIAQLGKDLVKVAGITGAPGYYYPPSDPVQP